MEDLSRHVEHSLGQLYQPLEETQLANPYPLYQRARREEPIFFSESLHVWVVTRYDDARTILSQANLFSSSNAVRPPVAFSPEIHAILNQGYHFVPSAINSDGERHKHYRRPLNRALEPHRVNAMGPLVRQIANRLIDTFYRDGKADIMTQFAMPLPLEIILSWFGIPQSDLAQCKRLSDDMLALFQSPLSPEGQAECAHSYVALQHYLAQLIEERRQEPGGDVISLMLQSSLTMDDLVIGLVGVLLGGHETTGLLIGSALYHLLSQRAYWEKLCEQPDLIAGAIEEALRYESPVQGFCRIATQDVQTGDVLIPKGAELLVVFGSANRDETTFPHAEHYDLHRSPNPHLAFGFGVHKCVGASLAQLEGQVALEVLCQRLPTLRLQSHQELSHKRTLQFRGFKKLQVEWDTVQDETMSNHHMMI